MPPYRPTGYSSTRLTRTLAELRVCLSNQMLRLHILKNVFNFSIGNIDYSIIRNKEMKATTVVLIFGLFNVVFYCLYYEKSNSWMILSFFLFGGVGLNPLRSLYRSPRFV
jgi:hypothetical protein